MSPIRRAAQAAAISPVMRTFLLLLSILAVSCGGRDDVPYVSLSKARPNPNTRQQTTDRPLRIAISAMLSPRNTIADYGTWVRYIARKMEMPSEIILKPSYAEAIVLLRDGEVDATLMCSGPFLDAQEEFGAQALVIPQVRGETVYRSYIIVRKESPYRNFADLRGKVFALTDPLSNTGKLFPDYLTVQAGSNMKRYFGRTFFTGGHDNSIEAVAEGLADGAAVDSLIWESLARKGADPAARTRVMLRSPPFGIPPVAVNPNLPKPMKERLRKTLLEMHRDPEGAAILSRLGFDRFVAAETAIYDSVRRMKAVIKAGQVSER